MDVDRIRALLAQGRYRVRPDGTIASTIRAGRILRPGTNPVTGYQLVSLMFDGRVVKEYVHRLVAAALCDGYQPGFVVNHKDGNRQNNRPGNLEWVSKEENLLHAKEVLGSRVVHLDQNGDRNLMAKLTEQQAREVFALRESGCLQREIAQQMDVRPSTISRILGGKRWSHLKLAA